MADPNGNTFDEIIAALSAKAQQIPSFLKTAGNATLDALDSNFAQPVSSELLRIGNRAREGGLTGLVGDDLRASQRDIQNVDPQAAVQGILGPGLNALTNQQNPIASLLFGQGNTLTQQGAPQGAPQGIPQGPLQGPVLPPQAPPVGPAPQAALPSPRGSGIGTIPQRVPPPPALAQQRPPDLSSIIGSLQNAGPQEAQQVGRNEKFSRFFGALAGGAAQGLKGGGGRAGTVADVLANAGGAGAQAAGAVQGENRLLQEKFDEQQIEQVREIARVQTLQEFQNASTDNANADALNRRSELVWQSSREDARLAYEVSRPIPLAGGGYLITDSQTGKVTRFSAPNNLANTVNLLKGIQALQKTASTESIQVFGKTHVRESVPLQMQDQTYAALQAANDPKAQKLAIEFLVAQGNDVIADRIQRVIDGTITDDNELFNTGAVLIQALTQMMELGRQGKPLYQPLWQNFSLLSNPILNSSDINAALGGGSLGQ